MVSTEGKLWFLSSFEHFWPDPYDILSKGALFFKKMHKVFKNKAQGCSTPLSEIPQKAESLIYLSYEQSRLIANHETDH